MCNISDRKNSSCSSLQLASLFSGAGGIDLGFEKAGFKMKGNTSRQWPEYWYEEGDDNWTAKPKRFSFGIKFDEELHFILLSKK